MSGLSFSREQLAHLGDVVREALIVHSIGAITAGQIARRHYTLFYAEYDARRTELAEADPQERDRILREIAEEAHAQELAERQADERARDPSRLTAAQRLDAFILGLTR